MMSKCKLYFMGTFCTLIMGVLPLSAATYQAVPVDAQGGYIEVYDHAAGIEYGMARINYSYWRSGDLWYYAYQIFNNDYFNTPTLQSDDYHFGWLYIEGQTPNPAVYDTIHKFSINLDPGFTGSGPTDIAVLDTQGGSSAGGGAWGHSIDPNNDGVDWSVSLGSDTPLPIAPTRGESFKVKGVWTWNTYNGGTSRNDTSGQCFQIASSWSPALRTAAISAGVDKQASGLVMAPGIEPLVIPEPSSLTGLASVCSLAGLIFVRRKTPRR